MKASWRRALAPKFINARQGDPVAVLREATGARTVC
jgi:hypothetical protein